MCATVPSHTQLQTHFPWVLCLFTKYFVLPWIARRKKRTSDWEAVSLDWAQLPFKWRRESIVDRQSCYIRMPYHWDLLSCLFLNQYHFSEQFCFVKILYFYSARSHEIMTVKSFTWLNAVFWAFYSSNNPEKKYIVVSTKILRSTTIFNIDKK